MVDAALLDMLSAARAAIRFTAGVSFEEFAQDEMRQAAVIQKLTVLGEAAKRVPPVVREAYPQIDWRGPTGLRDRLVHEYDKVIAEIVWRIVRDDLPAIVRVLEPLSQEPPE